MKKIIVTEGTVGQVFNLLPGLPEITGHYTREDYENRLMPRQHLILIASIDSQAVGFKAGYAQPGEKYFYSWMGGVLPEFRRMGIASKLAGKMEQWAFLQGFDTLRFKTWNKHTNMILLGINRGYLITGFEKKHNIEENRIIFEKQLGIC